MSSCEQIGATVHVPVCLADQINVEGLQVLLQIYLLWLYNLSLYWSTIFMHVHFQYPCVHQLNAIWNAKAMDISTILQLLSTKIKSISQTQSKWIKSHNDKNQDDLDDNLNHTLGFHCTSQIMTQWKRLALFCGWETPYSALWLGSPLPVDSSDPPPRSLSEDGFHLFVLVLQMVVGFSHFGAETIQLVILSLYFIPQPQGQTF